MKLFYCLCYLLTALSLDAKPKIAVVDMDEVFSGLSRKVEVEQEVDQIIAGLKNSPRVLAVQEVDAKLKDLAKKVRDKKLAGEIRELAAEEFNSLAIEHQSLLQEMEQFLKDEKRKATLYLVETIEELIKNVRAEIEAIGKEQGFDLILEERGKTSSQVSAIIYLRDKTDITALVLSRLNAKSTPAKSAPSTSIPEG